MQEEYSWRSTAQNRQELDCTASDLLFLAAELLDTVCKSLVNLCSQGKRWQDQCLAQGHVHCYSLAVLNPHLTVSSLTGWICESAAVAIWQAFLATAGDLAEVAMLEQATSVVVQESLIKVCDRCGGGMKSVASGGEKGDQSARQRTQKRLTPQYTLTCYWTTATSGFAQAGAMPCWRVSAEPASVNEGELVRLACCQQSLAPFVLGFKIACSVFQPNRPTIWESGPVLRHWEFAK